MNGSGGQRGGMGNNNMMAGMKRRWDSAGQSDGQNNLSKRPTFGNGNSRFSNGSGAPPSSGYGANKSFAGSAPKPAGAFQQNYYKPSYEQNQHSAPTGAAYQTGYSKFPSFPSMTMPPTLGQYPGPIAAAVAAYTFPPPQSGAPAMPPLPKN